MTNTAGDPSRVREIGQAITRDYADKAYEPTHDGSPAVLVISVLRGAAIITMLVLTIGGSIGLVALLLYKQSQLSEQLRGIRFPKECP